MPGGRVGYIAIGAVLCVADIANPLGIEGCGIEVFHHNATGALSVSGIGQTLAMGAIGRDGAMHVVLLRAFPDGENLVEEGIGAFEGGVLAHIGIYGFGLQVSLGELVNAADIGLAEDKPGEVGSIGLPAGSLCHIALYALGRLALVVDADGVSG